MPTRRGFIRQAFAVTAAVGAGGYTLTRGHNAKAQKAPKQAVQYQPDPKGDQQCTNCQFWIPPEGGQDMGGCQIVAGEIDPTGWCNLWAKA
ncbi:hypothetical protein CKO21_17490 [Rhodovibrio salinarum]|uniref:High potential iron-sulfur proteins family profile domain-containing protein n=2 Tax=Rhodovibrio salinarum TaxID=1087 RepID=A0A934V247_9PROT|nr:hypothetical protein [Rhodovibrio salinarum]